MWPSFSDNDDDDDDVWLNSSDVVSIGKGVETIRARPDFAVVGCVFYPRARSPPRNETAARGSGYQ